MQDTLNHKRRLGDTYLQDELLVHREPWFICSFKTIILSRCCSGSIAICSSVSWRTCIINWAFSGSAPARWGGSWGGGPRGTLDPRFGPGTTGGGFLMFGNPFVLSLGSRFLGSRRGSSMKGAGRSGVKAGASAILGSILIGSIGISGLGTTGGRTPIGTDTGGRTGTPNGGTWGLFLCNMLTAVSGSTILKYYQI